MANPAASSLHAARRPLPAPLEPELFQGLSVYQDVVLGGQMALAGARDCQGRWRAIEPHLPPLGAVLDVGSNFGWFGLQLASHAPRAVVASVEADERSAAVQRRVLASHDQRRVVLLTHPAGTRMAQRFAASPTRFDAVLCLAVLHWMRDHRQFLTSLAPVAGRIFIEQPDPRESGAGIERLRREIGSVGRYLREIFPGRAVRQLAELPNDRESPYPRELWMVEEPAGWRPQPEAGLDVAALDPHGPQLAAAQLVAGEWGMGNAEWGMQPADVYRRRAEVGPECITCNAPVNASAATGTLAGGHVAHAPRSLEASRAAVGRSRGPPAWLARLTPAIPGGSSKPRLAQWVPQRTADGRFVDRFDLA